MDTGKLKGIIVNKNERLERDALHEAEVIIERIAEKQQLIAKTQIDIASLREQLAVLEVKQLDSEQILGS